jgi:hypothetical protein
MQQPVTIAEERAFLTVKVHHQSLLHAVRPNNHLYHLLLLMGPYLYDCSQWHQQEQCRACPEYCSSKQHDDVNTESVAQNADILRLQDQLTKVESRPSFHRQQAVPPPRRYRYVSSEADNALTPNALFRQSI